MVLLLLRIVWGVLKGLGKKVKKDDSMRLTLECLVLCRKLYIELKC